MKKKTKKKIDKWHNELKENYKKSQEDYKNGRFTVMTAEEMIEFIKSHSKKNNSKKLKDDMH